MSKQGCYIIMLELSTAFLQLPSSLPTSLLIPWEETEPLPEVSVDGRVCVLLSPVFSGMLNLLVLKAPEGSFPPRLPPLKLLSTYIFPRQVSASSPLLCPILCCTSFCINIITYKSGILSGLLLYNRFLFYNPSYLTLGTLPCFPHYFFWLWCLQQRIWCWNEYWN